MQISNYKHQSINNFKGYSADTPIKSLIMVEPGHKCAIAKELGSIGKDAGFDVFVFTLNKLENIDNIGTPPIEPKSKQKPFLRDLNVSQWIQDHILQSPQKKIIINDKTYEMLAEATNTKNNLSGIKSIRSPEGGNMYFVKNHKGEYELYVGKDDKRYFFNKEAETNNLVDYSKLQENFGVKKITFLPQMDYHLDLFIRPLDNKRVLLTDDSLTLKMLETGICKFEEAIKNCKDFNKKERYKLIAKLLKKEARLFTEAIKENVSHSKTPEKTEKILKNNNFEVLKIPGRLFSVDENLVLVHKFNFLNAIVTKNKNGELVYMTGKSDIDEKLGITPEIAKEVGFSIQDYLTNSVSKYIKKENIHFVSGIENELQDKLTQCKGGLHCITTEIVDI